MSKSQFRFILTIYCLVVGCLITADMLSRGQIPDWIKASEFVNLTNQHSLGIHTNARFALIFVSGVFAWAGIAGLVCMFFLARFGCFLFLGGASARLLMPPLIINGWQAMPVWVSLFGNLQFLLDGLIIALVFFGTARDLFEKNIPKSI